MGKFILGNLDRKPLTGGPGPDNLYTEHPKKWMGHCLVSPPFEAHTAIDFTGPPGSVAGIYYSLMFQLRKWEYNVEKSDENIEVSPVHAQYYQLTHKQKEDLEGRIKSGLQSVSQATADLELILHDKRKYDEFLRYMGYRTPKEIKCKHSGKEHPEFEQDELCLKVDENEKTRKEREKLIDNHSLKAVFIDQVDVHTGDGIAMKSIVSRWPTLIIDFMKLLDEDMDVDKVANDKKMDISKAEAVVLVTKNKLFVEWKRLFLGNLKDRYGRIMSLKIAREKSVSEYKDWLKPILARHKLITEGLSSEGGRAANLKSFINLAGQAVSFSTVEIWVWKDFSSPEFFKSGSEDMAKNMDAKNPWEMKITPYDSWTKNNLIFNSEHGLALDYPWITDEWCKEQLAKMYNDGWLTKHKMYYSFFIIKLEKGNVKTPTGDEIEDGIFDVNMIVMSQNAMFVKLLELKAKQQNFEDYVNEMVGVKRQVEGSKSDIKENERLKPIREFFEWFSLNFQFFYRGPYEKNFEDRVTKYYLAPIAGERYGAIVGFIKSKIGMGG